MPIPIIPISIKWILLMPIPIIPISVKWILITPITIEANLLDYYILRGHMEVLVLLITLLIRACSVFQWLSQMLNACGVFRNLGA